MSSNLYKRVPGEGETKSLGAVHNYLDNTGAGAGMVIVPYFYPGPTNFSTSTGASMRVVHGRAADAEWHVLEQFRFQSMPSFVSGAPFSLDELSHLNLLKHWSDEVLDTYNIINNDPGPDYVAFQLTDGVLG